jgi:uncharacterized membrane protein
MGDHNAGGDFQFVSTLYLCLKWVHIISSTVLFGMGAGIAFFFLRAQRTQDVRIIAAVSRDVVVADAVFTAAAVVLQPVTGVALASMAGYPLTAPWLAAALALYVLIGCCWLAVVWLQIRMRDLAQIAASLGTPLPPAYYRYYRRWFALGWPAFVGVLVIFYLMVAK